MADDIRIKDLQSTASYMESDDYIPIDSLALGDRKIPFTGLMDSEDDRLPTTAKSIRGALGEHEGDISEIKSSLVNKQSSTVTNSGVSVRYLIRGGICTLSITGRPTTTNNLTFTIPKAYIGFHKTEPQWGDTSNLIQYWIDDGSTTLTIRNHSLNNLNASASYCLDFS